MTSTPPTSLKDSSLNGSWIDINSASQTHSPMESNDSPEFLLLPNPSCQLAASNNLQQTVEQQQPNVQQNLGLISFQVERFLQEVQRNQLSASQQNISLTASNGNQGANNFSDDNSGIYMSDTDVSLDDLDSKALINSLKIQQKQEKQQQQMKLIKQMQFGGNTNNNNNNSNKNNASSDHLDNVSATASGKNYLSKHSKANYGNVGNGDFALLDQLSDSLSILSRAASAFGDNQLFDNNQQPATMAGGTNFSDSDLDWLWDWTAQPEYFAGQEWKVYAPKQEYLLRQRQLYNNHKNNFFSSEVMSLLFLTNILSIIIGAGLTYSIMMRTPSN